MPERGKIDRSFFERHVRPNLGADREDVALGPTHGVDFGVLSVGDRALVCATDPVSILPGLGWDRAARFALGVVLADVAVAGVAPTHIAISFSLPTGMDDGAFREVWAAMDAALTDLGTAVLTGHTARYDGASFPWVGAATGMAVADPGDVVRPDGARPGDRLLVTAGPGVEAAALFASLYPDEIPAEDATVSAAADRLPQLDHVRGAVAAAAAGDASAMHDATEGGLHGALNELAAAAGVRVEFAPDRVPFPAETRAVAEALGFDPWAATSSGSLLVCVRPEDVDDVLEALREEDLAAAEVGRVRARDRVLGGTDDDGSAAGDSEVLALDREDPPGAWPDAIDGDRVPAPEGDSSWPVYARLSGHDE